MTCAEFFALTHRDIFKTTLAERVAARKHVDKCKPCRALLMSVPVAEDNPRGLAVDALCAEDMLRARYDAEANL